MKARALLVLMLGGLLGIGDDEEPGWLATALASTDPDVEAAIVAYEAGELDRAGEHLDAAVARRGERSELYYDRGLLLLAGGDADGARTAFQHGTESSELQVQASSHYELGNLAFATEDWQGAIDAYIACLRAQPDHQNAKWNLELALLRKQEQEKKDKEQQEKDQEKKDQQGEQDQEKQDQEKQDQEKQDQEKQDQEKQGEQKPDQQPGEQEKQDQEKQDQEKQDQEKQGQQPQPKPGEQEQQAQPIEQGDLDAALDELDRRDAFMFGRPRGNRRKVEKDW